MSMLLVGWRPIIGDLVIIRSVLIINCKKPRLGIIIKCSEPSFGINEEEFFDVLLDGRLENFSQNVIWPFDEEFLR